MKALNIMLRRSLTTCGGGPTKGQLPIIVDASSCTHGILENIPTVLSGTDKKLFSQLRILDVVE
ncbi:hypothetical protein [Corynebacterium diphtheriae]|uniref:hypothetical protein n=1 Tax=Corynebacterium diphtheriae TaxID=1717 RepID=UPI001FD306DB|nr:hypothetical protein [Corynebacterium diphtheriae]